MPAILSSLLFIWAGILLGVSFVATPAKFLAPSVPLAQLLDIGRTTFGVLAWIEWPLVAVALLATFVGSQGLGPKWKRIAACLAAIASALAVQGLWLMPILDARLLAIMAGQTIPASRLHEIYIGLDAAKLGLIVVAGATAIRSTPPDPPPHIRRK